MLTNLSMLDRALDPFPLYREMRHKQPAYFDPDRQNWNIFRFADVQRVLSDWEVFSSQFSGSADQGSHMVFAASMISSDPPRHRQLRSLVTQAFTPKAVENLTGRIHEIVREHLDAVVPSGRMDVIQDLGYPLPVIVIAEMLGIPSADRDRFKHWSDAIVELADFEGNVNPEDFTSPEIMEMSAYFFDLIQKRQANPGDDLISGLLQAEIEGKKLDMLELLGFCALLLVAGNETTTNLIGNAMLTFAGHPQAWERLRREPARLPQAIEEVLRYRSPVQSMFRVARVEAEIAGVTIPAGAPLVAWIGSANHDETQFPDPEKFDLDREPNKHIAFGHGIHYCLGAPLARLESRIALSALLERLPNFHIAPEAQVERLPSMLVYGLRSLPIEF